jgi:DNA-binding CsgD family transcriptional regulator
MAHPFQSGRCGGGVLESQARLLRKWKLYGRVQDLHATGMSLRKIGEALGLARNTVRKYFRQAPEPPLPTPRPLRASRLDPYEDYLLQRWSQGESNAAQLYREINVRGYLGCATMVRAYVAHLRSTTANGTPPSLPQGACQGHLATRITLAADPPTGRDRKGRSRQVGSVVGPLARGANGLCLTASFPLDGPGAETSEVMYLDGASDEQWYS